MENWRLSRIEEELDRLDFRENRDSRKMPGVAASYTIKPAHPRQEEERIYSKIVIKPAYKSPQSADDKNQHAAKVISGKYDSLERVRVPRNTGSGSSNSLVLTDLRGQTTSSGNKFQETVRPASARAVSSVNGVYNDQYTRPTPDRAVSALDMPTPAEALTSVDNVYNEQCDVSECSNDMFPLPPWPATHDDERYQEQTDSNSLVADSYPLPPRPLSSADIMYQDGPVYSGDNFYPDPPVRPKSCDNILEHGDRNRYVDTTRDVGYPPYRHDPLVAPPTFSDRPHQLSQDYGGYNRVLAEHEIVQVDMFFRSHKSDVYVCQCMVNVYFGTIKSTKSPTKNSDGTLNTQPENWAFYKCGIPVIVLDSGESRRKRKLHLILAERGTGFVLWRQSLNHLTNYKTPYNAFHTMHLSNDHTRMAGINFDDTSAAMEFFQKLKKFTSDPDDDMLNLSGSRKSRKKDNKRKTKSSKKYKPPSKADISTPCCFTHVTKLDRGDGLNLLDANHALARREITATVMPAHTTNRIVPGLRT